MIKCLMLDVDGVLVDGRPDDGQRWDHKLHEDLAIPSEALGREFFAREWQDIVLGRTPLLPALAAALKRIDVPITAEALAGYWFRNDSRVVDTVLTDVRAARRNGLRVFLTTNQEHMRAAYLMETMGLGDEVDGIVYSARLGSKKPQPAFFDAAVLATGAAPDELLLVDDTAANVDAARLMGWQAVHWDGSDSLSAILQRFAPK